VCGRFTLRVNAREVAKAFDVEAPLFEPRYNIAPSTTVPLVRANGHRTCTLAKWGLIPSWSKESKGIPNARAETVASKPSFRGSFRHKRCLMPADGFYEWKAVKGKKLPFFFRLKDHLLFAFAALWDRWQDVETCALITTEANAVVREIHERMPVIFRPEDYDRWLDPGTNQNELQDLLRPYAGKMEALAVSTRVNKATEEGPDLIKPLNDSLF
jgi:putative SOS response-associated peptidase YedK